ncbi:MAG TPA: hypothetical protein VHU41_10915 [Thermoanaerobaculia bacterium]|nr:hypothetical protein [Thermoanaerobaculia bacterium]
MSRRQTEQEDVDLLDEEQEPVVTDNDVDDFFEDDEKPTDRRRDPLRMPA